MLTTHRSLLFILLGLLLVASVCSSSSLAVQESTATPPAEGSALARLYELLDFVNNDDIPSLYVALTPDVQAQITLEQLRGAFESVEQGTGGQINISIEQVHEMEEEGDLAEIEVTLRITSGTAVNFTLRQVAILQRIEGVWRLADHFLQTAFVALGVIDLEELERQFDAEGCLLGDVLAGVYAPTRLQVLDPCMTTSGTVYDLTNETDGDITFNLDVPPEDQYLLNDENRSRKGGKLHIEIIPADQGRLTSPANGERRSGAGDRRLGARLGPRLERDPPGVDDRAAGGGASAAVDGLRAGVVLELRVVSLDVGCWRLETGRRAFRS